jgi:hypothetical protein
MAKSTTTPFTQNIRTVVATINTATGSIQSDAGLSPNNTILFLSGLSEGSIVKSISISSTDTSARVVSFYISKDFGANKHLLFSISIPITSGFTASGSTLNIVPLTTSNLLFQSLVDQVGDQVLTLSPNTEIYIGVTSTVTASKNIYLIAQLEDF